MQTRGAIILTSAPRRNGASESFSGRSHDEVYSCDLVFYNYLARCFFLVDLKVGKVTPQDIGQMQLYKHYYEQEMMNPGDNPPVGIVLGSDTDSAVVKYTLNEHERNLFAVKYHLSLPTVEEIRRELQRERAAIEEAMLFHQPSRKLRLAANGSKGGVRRAVSLLIKTEN